MVNPISVTNRMRIKPNDAQRAALNAEKLYKESCDTGKTYNANAPQDVKFLLKLSKYLGSDTVNIIVNALGAAYAGIFIAVNPVSNTDENTKKYAGLRYPLSAVIGAGVQAGVSIPFGKMLKHQANTGSLNDDIDLRFLNDKDFIEKNIRKYYTPDEVEKVIKERNPEVKSSKEIKKLVKKEYARLAEEEYVTRMKNAVKNMLYEGTLVVTNDNAAFKEIAELIKNPNNEEARKLLEQKRQEVVKRMPSDKFKEVFTEVIKRNVKILEQQIVRYENEKWYKQSSRALFFSNDLLRTNTLKFLDELEEHINALNIKDKTVPSKELHNWLTEKINKSSDTIKEPVNIIKDIRDRQIVTSIEQYIKDLRGQIKKGAESNGIDGRVGNITRDLLSQTEDIKQQIDILNDIKYTLANNIGKNSTTYMRNILEKAQNIKEFDLFQDLISSNTKRIKGSLKILSQVGGIFVSIPTVAVSCILLNWAHPRFIEKFFPEVAQSENAMGKRYNNVGAHLAASVQDSYNGNNAKGVRNA